MDSKEQISRIRKLLLDMKKNGENIVDLNVLKRHLNKNDYMFACNMFYEMKKRNKKDIKKNNVFILNGQSIIKETEKLISTSPYQILEIEEKDYTKDELLKIVENKIKYIQISEDKKLVDERIDRILDAYNVIFSNKNDKKL